MARYLNLRTVLPAIILMAFIADVTLRFIPPSHVTFRAWEAATLFQTASGPFAPNLRYANGQSFGDLSNLGNLPWARQYHREVFTTDNEGFRLTPGAAGLEPSVLLLGDSFAAGSGISDVETLSSQIARLGHTGVFNAGGIFGAGTRRMIEPLIRAVGLKDGFVIYLYSERFDLPDSIENRSGGLIDRLPPVIQRHSRVVGHIVSSCLLYSPLEIWLTRAFKRIENGVWLPNVTAETVVVSQLKNGQAMLFLPGEIKNFIRQRPVDVRFFDQLNSVVKATGNHLLVLLVPDKYNVYWPLLKDSNKEPPGAGRYLAKVAEELTRLGITAIDLTDALRRQADSAISSRRYNYLTDDTHWNAAGAQLSAEQTVEAMGRFTGATPVQQAAPAPDLDTSDKIVTARSGKSLPERQQ